MLSCMIHGTSLSRNRSCTSPRNWEQCRVELIEGAPTPSDHRPHLSLSLPHSHTHFSLECQITSFLQHRKLTGLNWYCHTCASCLPCPKTQPLCCTPAPGPGALLTGRRRIMGPYESPISGHRRGESLLCLCRAAGPRLTPSQCRSLAQLLPHVA